MNPSNNPLLACAVQRGGSHHVHSAYHPTSLLPVCVCVCVCARRAAWRLTSCTSTARTFTASPCSWWRSGTSGARAPRALHGLASPPDGAAQAGAAEPQADTHTDMRTRRITRQHTCIRQCSCRPPAALGWRRQTCAPVCFPACRPEVKFSGLQELLARINTDIGIGRTQLDLPVWQRYRGELAAAEAAPPPPPPGAA